VARDAGDGAIHCALGVRLGYRSPVRRAVPRVIARAFCAGGGERFARLPPIGAVWELPSRSSR
jgi:hypothetical protein